MMKLKLILAIIFLIFNISLAKKKKDARDFTDADIYKLDEEWLEDGDIDEGDLPEHMRPSNPIDMSKLDTSNPEELLKASKKHKTLMMFVTISGDPTEAETEKITHLWQSMLNNANIELQRFVISPNRILIKLSDGSYAYEIKDFLVQQERCQTVTIEGKDYPGKGSEQTKTKKVKGGTKKKTKTDKNKKKSEL